uniref:Uncharacterized protein n=1 Tax=Mucochytrium quahogii TaxID=96639 RepID=A0A7S2RMU5_9STRA|mmetsp:Transcript_1329/g.1706  ORF Transcript_1329/g.1706 Transcript_1329/m.1706 type:complete len:676 (+) Transcript_1329:547-2574(+)|eukprot:CAMPEP_0203746522 /NCGR_PEP_ID=MMETSP0098-20131031/1943_1 /ASSEMBLY_ACC=CAM_ASM_000208 /TAXON_ID=96639 /ORGANISM=" , Strain NY0313808BC1" /LENGTH=675 /DNA_ID=CAMNT_0050634653 /DNA_START=664 /DNA_END=2691 /DNA_ORIENTATION=-
MALVHLTMFLCMMFTCTGEVTMFGDYTWEINESNDPVIQTLLTDDHREGNFNFFTYTVGIIFDPCRGHSPSCCNNTFGEPEYVREEPKLKVGWIWALSRITKKPYKCQKPCYGHWVPVNDHSEVHDYTFEWIDADERLVWALNKREHKLYSRLLDGSTKWSYVSGDFKSFSTSGYYALYGVDRVKRGVIVACKKPCTGEWKPPVEVPGHPFEGRGWQGPELPEGEYSPYKMVDADATHVWTLLENGRLFVKQVILPQGSMDWPDMLLEEDFPQYGYQWAEVTLEDAKLVHISTSAATGVIWALDDKGNPYVCAIPCIKTSWIVVRAPETGGGNVRKLIDIDADQQFVWGIVEGGQVYVRPVALDKSNEVWVAVPASNDKTQITLDAWNTVPEGGFLKTTASASPHYYDPFPMYTVQEFGMECALYDTKMACDNKKEDMCKWSVVYGRCEKAIRSSNSRLPSEDIIFDDTTCVLADEINFDGTLLQSPGYALMQEKEGAEMVVVRDPECVDVGVRKKLPEERPACWDHNETVKAHLSCYDHHGEKLPFCVSISYTSTSYIVRCGGELENSPKCGTFLEIHRPGDATVINTARLPHNIKFTSGYRPMALPTTFSNYEDPNFVRTICYGYYEVWWVQRTKTQQIVEAVKKFRVLEPLCDWNAETNTYEVFATLPKEDI